MKRKYSILIFLVGVISAFGYIIFHNIAPLAVNMIFKTLPCISMCVWMIIKKLDKINSFIFIGIFLSLVCDIFMLLDLITIGMVFNMIALVFYTIYFVRSDPSLDIYRVIPFFIILTIFYIILYKTLEDNKIPVLIYCILYIVFLWRSSARIGEKHISKLSQWVCFFGVLLIAGSDFLLSLMLFSVISYANILYMIVMICWWTGLFFLMITAELKKQVYLKLSVAL
ncbi:MAG: lysoplasmalogenase [Spirochaetaceae bacterium]